ncbi:MAG: ABC transporter substrate-binding protein [Smithellaceae bacterium]|jgi:branched-chain amino acid transport system substrate-binding protein|nr:ABC transporter substrate-binding protein [Smithellaceae bacterium]
MKKAKIGVKTFTMLCLTILTVLLLLRAGVVEAEEISVGIIGPMKFALGDHSWKGANIAADEINAAGGIKFGGKLHKVKLVQADDDCLTSIPNAVSAMKRLVNVNKVNFVVGGFRSEAVLAQQEVMADNKIIFLGTGSSAAEQNERLAKDFERYKYWFRIGNGNAKVGIPGWFGMIEPVIRAVRKDLGIQKPRVAMLIDKHRWAEPIADISTKLFTEMGCEVVGIWRPSVTATNVSTELSAIKSAGAHIIFTQMTGPSGNAFARQWGELKIPAAMAGVNLEVVKEVAWEATGGRCNYALVSDVVAASSEKTKRTKHFLAEFKKRYNELPLYTGSGGYDAIYLLKEVIEKAQSLDAEALIPVIEMTTFTGTMGTLKFTPRSAVNPHDLIWGPHYYWGGIQWIDGKRYDVWPDGHEISPALVAIGAPKGWDKVRPKGTRDYVLPPWVVEYWKNKK